MKARFMGLSGVFPSARQRSVLKCRVPLSAHLTEQHLSALRHELSIQRDLRGLTYDDLALASGVSRRTLMAIEVGKSRGSVESWLHICEALGTTFAQFMEDSVAAHVIDVVPQTNDQTETVTQAQ